MLFSGENTTQFKFRNMDSSSDKVEICKHHLSKTARVSTNAKMAISIFLARPERRIVAQPSVIACIRITPFLRKLLLVILDQLFILIVFSV